MWEGSKRLIHKHVGGQQKVNSQNLRPWSRSKCGYFGQHFLLDVYVIVWEGRCTCHIFPRVSRMALPVLLDLSCKNQSKSMLHCCSWSCTSFWWNSKFSRRVPPLYFATLKDHSLHICWRFLVPIGCLALCNPLTKARNPPNLSQNFQSALIYILGILVFGTHCLVIWEMLSTCLL